VYGRVATSPDGAFHFHRGPRYAATMLGYDPDRLAALPAEALESFAGIGNPLRLAPIPPGATVIDIGCGAGMDLLLAAAEVGPTGRAIGIDMTDEMVTRAQQAAETAGFTHVEVRLGDALDLPVPSQTADFVISNGVLNLTPDKVRAYSEAFRVLKPGGAFLYADIVIAAELDESARRDIDLWTG
jgi:SAM-dependent methyltransferase